MNPKLKQRLDAFAVEFIAWTLAIGFMLGIAGCVMLVLRCIAGIFIL